MRCFTILCSHLDSAVGFSQVGLALPILAALLNSEDEEVLADTCWALSYLSQAPNMKTQEIIESNVCPRLVELLKHSSLDVVRAVVNVVGNIVNYDYTQIQFILDCNALECLVKLLDSPEEFIREQALFIMSNIAAGNRDQIQVILFD